MIRTHDVSSPPNGRSTFRHVTSSVFGVKSSLSLIFLSDSSLLSPALHHRTTEHPKTPRHCEQMTMSSLTIWRARWNEAIHHFFWVACVSATYLTTELNIWGLSYVLASAQLQYFGSIVGMILVFSIMTAAGQACQGCDAFYHRWIKSKVCHFAQLPNSRRNIIPLHF